MTTKIFVNLAVKNLDTSIEFFKTLGFAFNRNSPTKRPPAW
jgi:predicted lactoylglutathione lyase